MTSPQTKALEAETGADIKGGGSQLGLLFVLVLPGHECVLLNSYYAEFWPTWDMGPALDLRLCWLQVSSP